MLFELENTALTLITALGQKRLTVATAESCSGGMVAVALTAPSGASLVYKGSAITYSDELKQRLLGVGADTLKKYGAVSKEVALEMAQGVISATGCHLGLAITGIAGPTGGSTEKPVGTVHTLAMLKDRHIHHCNHFKGGRDAVRLQSSLRVLRDGISLLAQE